MKISSCFKVIGAGGGRVVLSIMAHTWRLRMKGEPFSGFRGRGFSI